MLGSGYGSWIAGYTHRVWNVEADGALRDEEGLVVHFVPVRWGPGGSRWENQFSDA